MPPTPPGGADHPIIQGEERNRLLRELEPRTYQRVINDAEALELPARYTLWPSRSRIRSVYFPRSCVVSLIMASGEDLAVEAATVGNEGFVGVPLALGADTTTMTAMAQVAGHSLRLPAAAFVALLTDDAAFRVVMLAYAHTLLEQTAQTVVCNRRHELGERCARWLLMTHDRVGNGTFVLTQDFLALMLGVRRAGVTVAAGMLQRAGLIRYSRGRVEVLDRDGLEAASCECYRIVVDAYRHTVKAS